MKLTKLAGLVLGLAIFAISVNPARASEGQAALESKSIGGPKCLVNSVFIDTTYHVLVTCRDLVTPYSAEVTRYNLWIYNTSLKRWVSLGRINQGKLYTNTSVKFDQLQVTAEAVSSPRQPSEFVVASGMVVPFDFDKGSLALTPTPTPTPTPNAANIVPSPVASGNVVGNAVRTVVKLLVVGFVVLLVGVVVMTVITRRREA